MKHTHSYQLLPALLACLFFLNACIALKPAVQAPAEHAAVDSIIILPVETLPDFNKKEDADTARQLQTGADALTGLLNEYFSETGIPVTFISETQKEAITADFTGYRDSLARIIGQKLIVPLKSHV